MRRATRICVKAVTIAGFVETMAWVVVRGVYVDGVAERLQTKCCVDDEPFGAA